MTRKSNKQITSVAPPPHPDPKRAERHPAEAKERRLTLRGSRDPNAEKPKQDHLFTVASRARWGEGDITEQNRTSMELDGTANGGGSEEEEEEEQQTIEPAKMKKAELQEALREAGVAFETDDNKDRLVELYSDYLADNQ